MIYLIDDNQNNQRKEAYSISFVDDGLFSGCLTPIEKIPKNGGSEDFEHLTFLNDASCLLVHSTTEDTNIKGKFMEGSNTNVIKIKERISVEGEKIPLVLFSNKMDETAVYDHSSNPSYITAIKKNKFYERLYDFVEHYHLNKEIDLRIIAFGNNFESKEVTGYAEDLLMYVAFDDGSAMLNLGHISSINTFRKFIKKAGLKNSFDDIVNSLEDNPISIQDFRDKINQITESFTKYGKNIYDWE